MKPEVCPSIFGRCLFITVLLGSIGAQAQQPTKPVQPPAAPATTPKPTPTPATAKELIAQGIQQYRKGKYDVAAKQFLAALKLEPNNDEALGYGSLTAYQLGNLAQARDLFQHRADLPNQKSSVKVFSTYMVGLTRWRQAHEIIAKGGEIKALKTIYKLTDKELLDAQGHITGGLETIKKVLLMKPDYTEAVNVRNLLHAEAAAIATDESKAKEETKAALEALRQAIKLYKGGTEDFGAPTVLLGVFGSTDEEQEQIKDPMLAMVEGGRPLSRATAVLPVIKIAPAKPKSSDGEPAPTGIGPGGGAISVGPGQGALRPSKTEAVQLKGGVAKVEVLVNTAGKVVFTRILDGPPATTGPALAAAKKWTFSPPKFEGTPVQVIGIIAFNIKSIGKDGKTTSKGESADKNPPTTKPKGKSGSTEKKP